MGYVRSHLTVLKVCYKVFSCANAYKLYHGSKASQSPEMEHSVHQSILGGKLSCPRYAVSWEEDVVSQQEHY